jgi:sulfatase modifying factor 1
MRDIEWALIPGGLSKFGDRGKPVQVRSLLWTITPLTRGQLGLDGVPELPVTSVTFEQAAEWARKLGGRLPRSSEWEWMAAGPQRRLYPWGDDEWKAERANLRDSGIGMALTIGQFPAGATPEGLLDVAGNVWEWTSSLVLGNGAVVRGGSYNSLALYARTTFLNAAPLELSSKGIGFRIVRDQ